jgi:hypothetical protein
MENEHEKYWKEHNEFYERDEFLKKPCDNLYHEFCIGDDGKYHCFKCGAVRNA